MYRDPFPRFARGQGNQVLAPADLRGPLPGRLSVQPPPEDEPRVSEIFQVVDPSRSGDAIQLNLTANIASRLVLPRQAGKRLLLAIVNTDLANKIYVKFGSAASSTSGRPINPGGDVFYDSFVPQDEVHIAAAANGTNFYIEFAYKDVGG
jgi:hypothetical protein